MELPRFSPTAVNEAIRELLAEQPSFTATELVERLWGPLENEELEAALAAARSQLLARVRRRVVTLKDNHYHRVDS